MGFAQVEFLDGACWAVVTQLTQQAASGGFAWSASLVAIIEEGKLGMGYMRHHAIIVTTWDSNKCVQAHAAAIDVGNICTEICDSKINEYHSFMIVPDGSKEGWGDSDLGDTSRSKFIGWLYQQTYEDGSSPFDWAEIVYGDDQGELSIRGAS